MRSSDANNSSRAATALVTRLEGNRVIDDLKQFRASTFHTPAEKHEISQITLLAGHDTLLVTAPSQLTPSHLSWLETRDMRMLIAHRVDSLYFKKCLTSGESQHQVVDISPVSCWDFSQISTWSG